MKIPLPRLLSILAVPLIILTALLTLLYWNQNKGIINLPDYGAAPGFQLIDQNGAAFEARSLAGKPWIGSFMFTRCPDMCPLMVLKLAKIAKRMPDMHFVSFSSDPDFDKPEILKEYVNRGVGPRNWTFLAGSKTELKKIAGALMVSAPDSPSLHSTRFILVDRNGRIRGFYDSQSSEQMNALAIDVRGL